MKDGEVLHKVRAYIANNDASCHLMICPSIFRHYNGRHLGSRAQRNRLTNWITSMLCGERCLENWLYVRTDHITGKEVRYGRWRKSTLQNLKATRLAWLDWMIAECEKAEASEIKYPHFTIKIIG